MSDPSTQARLQQSHAHRVSGEQLEVLGKTASAKYLSGECKTLTDAVSETVKKASLSPEQVKRVVEFANTDAFLHEFKKEGAGHHIVDFEGGPADPSEVLKGLNSGGGGTVFDRGTLDYHAPPANTKIASAFAEEGLEQMFEVKEAALPYSDPLGDAMDMRDKLAAGVEHLTSELTGLEGMYGDLCDRVYYEVKQAALGGNSLGDIAQVMAASVPSEEYVKCAFEMITPRLIKDEVYRSINEALSSMDKVASAFIINRSHPLVTEMKEYGECLLKMAELRGARDQMNAAYGEITHFVKNAGAAAEGLIPKAFRHANEGAKKVAPHVGHAAGAVKKHLVGGTGEKTKKVVERMVQHAPTAAGAAVALEGARRLSNSPTAQKTYHGAQAHLNPLSDDFKAETYYQQNPDQRPQ
jgi:hypothetical protein